jgi:short subunit dehydrogenase-like uncharacterized protein
MVVSATDSRFDLVVFGATGVTGRKVCERLASTGHTSWAIAGRNESALRAYLAELSALLGPASVAHVGVIVADVTSHPSLVAMARSAKVVLNIVGPYRFLGEPVVKACIEAVTHYVDVSGEPWFLEHIEHKYNSLAKAANVTIVLSLV